MKTNIVGTQFVKVEVPEMVVGSDIDIYHDLKNEFDNKALAVFYNKKRIGYIGKGSDVYDLPRNTFPKYAKVVDFYIREEGDKKFTKHQIGTLVSCNIEIPDVIKLEDKDNKISFNEGIIINFNERTHTYTFEGKTLVGATTIIKKFMKDFDSEFMIGRCSNSWGVKKDTIKDAWDLGANLAATFGTGIHKALEFEDRYRHLQKKNGDRCFNVKHPAIKRIIDEFYDLYDSMEFSGYVVAEALISDVENGICGLADRILILNKEDKICRIQDYKVNHSVEKKGSVSFHNLPEGFKKLATTKLSKFSLQLKCYAEMLEKSGWKVLGYDVFVYNEKWKYYCLDQLEGLNILD